MRRFEEIIDLAAERQGGLYALRKSLAETRPLAPIDIAAVPDHQIPSSMTRRVFYAGFPAKVTAFKWCAPRQRHLNNTAVQTAPAPAPTPKGTKCLY